MILDLVFFFKWYIHIGIHCTVIFFSIRICHNILSGISKSGQKIDLFYHLGPYIRVNNNYIVIRDVLHMIRALTDLFKLLGALVLHHYFRVITDENFCSNSFTKNFYFKFYLALVICSRSGPLLSSAWLGG